MLVDIGIIEPPAFSKPYIYTSALLLCLNIDTIELSARSIMVTNTEFSTGAYNTKYLSSTLIDHGSTTSNVVFKPVCGVAVRVTITPVERGNRE